MLRLCVIKYSNQTSVTNIAQESKLFHKIHTILTGKPQKVLRRLALCKIFDAFRNSIFAEVEKLIYYFEILIFWEEIEPSLASLLRGFGPVTDTACTSCYKAIKAVFHFHCRRFARTREATDFNLVFVSHNRTMILHSRDEIRLRKKKNQSPWATPRKLNVVQLPSVSARTKTDKKRSD